MPGRPLLQKAGLFGSDKAWKTGRGGDTVSAFTATDGLSETKGRSAPHHVSIQWLPEGSARRGLTQACPIGWCLANSKPWGVVIAPTQNVAKTAFE